MSLRQDPLDWWGALDGAVLHTLAEARGPLTLAEIGGCIGISEDAVRSVVAMLAEQGKVRIAAVELADGYSMNQPWLTMRD